MLTFDTSYSYDKISLKFISNKIKVKKLPLSLKTAPILITLTDECDKELYKCSLFWPQEDTVTLTVNKDGKYYLNLYTKTNPDDEYYWSYLQPRSLALISKDGRFHFTVSPVINNNRKIMAQIPTDPVSLQKYLKPSELCQSNNSAIIRLAKKITSFKVTPYQKILAIHDWVAGNIYSDYDSLNDLSCHYKPYSALEVLNGKKCVCRGFANLAVALMRAVGIPAIGLSCYSLNIYTDGGWEKSENQVDTSNHIIAVAYVESRWVYMDITWDSDNVFENLSFSKKRNVGVSRKYFDTTLEMISNTHKFIITRDL